MSINKYIEKMISRIADGNLTVEEAKIKVEAHLSRSEEDCAAYNETNEGGYLEAVLNGEITPEAGAKELEMWKASLADAKELEEDDGFSAADEYDD